MKYPLTNQVPFKVQHYSGKTVGEMLLDPTAQWFLSQVGGTVKSLSTVGSTGPATITDGVLNIPQYSVAVAPPTSAPLASTLSIATDGTDQTSRLNTILSSGTNNGMVIDFSPAASITINGTVNANGKTIKFAPGNSFTGTGTINNAVIDAGYRQKIFDITVSLTNSSTVTAMFSVFWYGAGIGGDDQAACQKSSDTVIVTGTKMTRDIYLPAATYNLARPWILHNWNGTTYGQFTVNLVGDYKAANSNTVGFANINTSYTNGPAIGIQRATSGSIRGLIINGNFTYSASFETFVQTSFAVANAAGANVRDSRYSPYGGIVIDPFTNGGLPPDGGYPTLSSWYRGDSSNGGTTDFKIQDCSVQGFAVDIMISPNGSTQQGEDCVVEDCKLNFANVGICYGQSQTDNCIVRKCRSWSFVWTVISTGIYGSGGGQAPNIDGYNIAGAINVLFDIFSQKPVQIQNFYAESFFTIGGVGTSTGPSVLQGNFDFQISNWQPQYHLQGYNLLVKGRLRYYDDLFDKRLRIKATNVLFQECAFDLPPHVPASTILQQPGATYQNCIYRGGSGVLGPNNSTFYLQASNPAFAVLGRFKFQDGFGVDSNEFRIGVTYDYNCANMEHSTDNICANPTVLTIDANRQTTFTTTTPAFLYIGDIIVDYVNRDVIGRITNIVGTTITLSEVPNNISSGSRQGLRVVYFNETKGSFVGDVTAGSPNITNVDNIALSAYMSVITGGIRYDNLCFANGVYVVSYNSGTRTVVMSGNSNKTAVRQNFVNGNPTVNVRAYAPPSAAEYNSYGLALPTGTIWTEMVNSSSSSVYYPTTWIFTKGGYINATTLGFGAGNQSEYSISPPVRFNGTNLQWYNTYTDTWNTVT